MNYNKILTLLCCLVALAALGGTPQEAVTSNYNRAGGSHYAYPYPADEALPELTPAPQGYEAFYISHYGRHGSRWLTHASAYSRPVEELERADSAGVLTPQGKRLLRTLREVRDGAWQRVGDLTEVGALQHQSIAARMVANFPGVFAGDACVTVRSSMVIRSILSMQNATMTLRALNPRLRITTDASASDMHYTGYGYGPDTLAQPLRKAMGVMADSIFAAEVRPQRFLATLVTDSAFAASELDGQRLMLDVFAIAGNMQSHLQFDHLNLFYLFTNDEIFDLWRLNNLYHYLQWAGAPHNGRRIPYLARDLLADIVTDADAAIAAGTVGAKLRYGHDTNLIALTCLMELDDAAVAVDDLDQVHLYWQDYRLIPKACNVQLVLYRPIGGNGDILAKVLLNEHEARLPVPCDGPYARWADLRDRYEQVLATPIDWQP